MFFCRQCNYNYDISKTPPTKMTSDASESDKDSNNELNLSEKKGFFVCKQCGSFEEIREGTMLINRISGVSVSEYNDLSKYQNMIHNNALPHTRHYICPNNNCISHNDHTKRDAVFFRTTGYNLKYMCTSCETIWRA